MSDRGIILKTICILLICLLPASVNAQEVVLTENGIDGLNIGANSLVSIEEIENSFPGLAVTQQEGYWEGPDFDKFSVTDQSGNLLFEIVSYRDDEKKANNEEYPIHKIYLGDNIADEYGIKRGDKISKAVSLRKHDLELIDNHDDNSIGKFKIYYKFNYPLTQDEIEKQGGVNWGFAPSIEEAINRNVLIDHVVWINWP